MTQTRKKTERKLGTAAKTTTGSVVGLLDIKERRTNMAVVHGQSRGWGDSRSFTETRCAYF